MNADVAYAYLEELLEYFGDRLDVDDGQPNKEMRLMNKCQEMLDWVEKMP